MSSTMFCRAGLWIFALFAIVLPVSAQDDGPNLRLPCVYDNVLKRAVYAEDWRNSERYSTGPNNFEDSNESICWAGPGGIRATTIQSSAQTSSAASSGMATPRTTQSCQPGHDAAPIKLCPVSHSNQWRIYYAGDGFAREGPVLSSLPRRGTNPISGQRWSARIRNGCLQISTFYANGSPFEFCVGVG